MAKQPWMKFFPADWLSDECLRAVTLAAKGLWIDLLCYMHKSECRGYLRVNGKSLSIEQISRLSSAGGAKETKELLDELVSFGVVSVADDGAYYSRRMVRDEDISSKRSDAGRAGGGNPVLIGRVSGCLYAMKRSTDSAIKIGVSSDPKKRRKDVAKNMRLNNKKCRVEILRTWPVDSMAYAEATVHEHFKDYRLDGEWFRIKDNQLTEIDKIVTGLFKQTSSFWLLASDLLPEGMQGEGMRCAWLAWEEYRAERKPRITKKSAAMAFKKLAEFGNEQRAIAAIEHSIASGYQGIFEPGGTTNPRPSPSRIAAPPGKYARLAQERAAGTGTTATIEASRPSGRDDDSAGTPGTDSGSDDRL